MDIALLGHGYSLILGHGYKLAFLSVSLE